MGHRHLEHKLLRVPGIREAEQRKGGGGDFGGDSSLKKAVRVVASVQYYLDR
jgi:hypothetical protein